MGSNYAPLAGAGALEILVVLAIAAFVALIVSLNIGWR
jgi:hypothetical protein